MRIGVVLSLFVSAFIACWTLLTPESAQARRVVSYWCLAQDGSYSYDGEGDTKAQAQAAALKHCHAQSDNPRACYNHRCEKRVTNIPERDPVKDPFRPRPDGRCSFDHQCGAFKVCHDGKCTDKDDRGCSSNHQCGHGEICESAKCIEKRRSRDACTSSTWCSGFKVCVDGMCVDDNSFDNRCHADHQCGTFGRCENFKCQR